MPKNANAARETEPGASSSTSWSTARPDESDAHEIYADEAAFEAHQQTPHFKHYLANALQYLESRERAFYRRATP